MTRIKRLITIFLCGFLSTSFSIHALAPSEIIESEIIHSHNNEYIEFLKTLQPPYNSGCEQFLEPRYGFTPEDIYLLAQLLCGDKNKDGDGEYDFDFGNDDNWEQISLVLCVIMNRVRSPLFKQSSVFDIVNQKNQFSVMPRNLKAEPSDIAIEKVTMWCTAYDNWDFDIQTIPENHIYFTGNGITNTSRSGGR